MSALHLQDVIASYGGQRVLGPLSLQTRPGECLALVGRSGAGKSTLLRMLFEQSRGEAAYMPQELGLVHSLSVFHNVFMGRLNHHATWYNLANLVKPWAREVAAIAPLLDKLAMGDKIWAPAGELSGGQKQRTAVARVLHQHADIVLADEPISALDTTQAEAVMTCLTQSYQSAVFAMHDVELALRFTQRIVGIRDGEVALDEPSHRLAPQDLMPLY